MRIAFAIGWLLTAFLIALLLTRAALAYAHRRGMLDQPGQRRSHQQATPRGGGIGLVVAMLVCQPAVFWSFAPAWPVGVMLSLDGALLLVALAGWMDDHRSLPIWPRLGAQVLAVGGFSVALLGVGMSWWWLPLLLGGGIWSVNLHNFMDGIDGILAQQALFVAAGLGCLAWGASLPTLALLAAALFAATLGFWYYNRPPARIFMGDVGSGSLGLLIFAFSAMLWQRQPSLLWPALILSSAFITDASMTLLTRMLGRRRWYAAHREHLYQWLVRSGMSHAATDRAYLAWNLLIAAPFAWLAWSHLRLAFPVTIFFYLAAAATWLALKRRCLRRHSAEGRHVTA